MYRIVHNPQTDAYRVEKRGMLGWAFVNDPQTGDYLDFEDFEQACSWVGEKNRRDDGNTRRWQIVSECSC